MSFAKAWYLEPIINRTQRSNQVSLSHATLEPISLQPIRPRGTAMETSWQMGKDVDCTRTTGVNVTVVGYSVCRILCILCHSSEVLSRPVAIERSRQYPSHRMSIPFIARTSCQPVKVQTLAYPSHSSLSSQIPFPGHNSPLSVNLGEICTRYVDYYPAGSKISSPVQTTAFHSPHGITCAQRSRMTDGHRTATSHHRLTGDVPNQQKTPPLS